MFRASELAPVCFIMMTRPAERPATASTEPPPLPRLAPWLLAWNRAMPSAIVGLPVRMA